MCGHFCTHLYTVSPANQHVCVVARSLCVVGSSEVLQSATNDCFTRSHQSTKLMICTDRKKWVALSLTNTFSFVKVTNFCMFDPNILIWVTEYLKICKAYVVKDSKTQKRVRQIRFFFNVREFKYRILLSELLQFLYCPIASLVCHCLIPSVGHVLVYSIASAIASLLFVLCCDCSIAPQPKGQYILVVPQARRLFTLYISFIVFPLV